MAVTPNSDSTTKNTKSKLGLTLAPAANVYPISYVEDTWDVVTNESADAAMRALMGSAGQFDQHKINKALAESSGSSTLGESVTAATSVGGIVSGDTLGASTTFAQFVKKLLIPYINPSATLSLTITGNKLREVGDDVSSVTMSVAVTKGTSDVSSVDFYVNNTLEQSTTSGVASGGTFTYTYSTTVSTDTTFKVIVTDSENKTTTSNMEKIEFVNPVYYGVSSTSTVSDITSLTKDVVKKSGISSYTFKQVNQYAVFAYDNNYGELSEIREGSTDYNVISGWTHSTSNGYYIYIENVPHTNSSDGTDGGETYTFKF